MKSPFVLGTLWCFQRARAIAASTPARIFSSSGRIQLARNGISAGRPHLPRYSIGFEVSPHPKSTPSVARPALSQEFGELPNIS